MRSLFLALLLLPPPLQDLQPPLRVGIIGLDTSHVVAFTQLLNDDRSPDHVPGARVVCAFKGGSPDIKESWDRLEGYTRTLQEKWGVEIVDTIPALCERVDAVLLESEDGRSHLEQVKPVFAAKKRVFIDKPLAGSWNDGVAVARVSKESGVPFFSASSVRFYETVLRAKQDLGAGKVLGAEATSPCLLEPHHPDLFWYGVHGVDALFSVMGAGCESVSRVHTDGFDVVVGRWKDGRIGTFRGIRQGRHRFGVTIFREKSERSSFGVEGKNDYRNLVVEIVKFLKGGEPPVSVDEMLEVLAFMQAADLSKERGGVVVRLDELR